MDRSQTRVRTLAAFRAPKQLRLAMLDPGNLQAQTQATTHRIEVEHATNDCDESTAMDRKNARVGTKGAREGKIKQQRRSVWPQFQTEASSGRVAFES